MSRSATVHHLYKNFAEKHLPVELSSLPTRVSTPGHLLLDNNFTVYDTIYGDEEPVLLDQLPAGTYEVHVVNFVGPNGESVAVLLANDPAESLIWRPSLVQEGGSTQPAREAYPGLYTGGRIGISTVTAREKVYSILSQCNSVTEKVLEADFNSSVGYPAVQTILPTQEVVIQVAVALAGVRFWSGYTQFSALNAILIDLTDTEYSIQ